MARRELIHTYMCICIAILCFVGADHGTVRQAHAERNFAGIEAARHSRCADISRFG
jgi:hypothetical protein